LLLSDPVNFQMFSPIFPNIRALESARV